MPNVKPTFSPELFGGFSHAASDIAGYFGTEIRGKFDVAEATSYDEAARLALQNEQFTEMSTNIQENQADRELCAGRRSSPASLLGKIARSMESRFSAGVCAPVSAPVKFTKRQ